MNNGNNNIKLITTEDGSHSIFVPGIQESYHSFHGAYREAIHVFMLYGLESWAARNPGKKPVRIFELGLGTGLNAWLSLVWAEQNQTPVLYHTIEPFPVEEEVYNKLNYPEMDDAIWHYRGYFSRIHKATWDQGGAISPYFNMKKEQLTMEQVRLYPSDVIFYDAFSPKKQPELWDVSLLEKVADAMNKDAVFLTYCASSKLKRDLAGLGLSLDSVPGPPGKKEMTRAWKL
ncbi:MAG TPA: tRNA (5-methylaminomethyl-2-thiouridine)(34)-methyltransferase MnmD [Cyclobacteriaceae bacterium]|nr:tRNA (5-methylaminomethyl-2-thiouridine)(34)-methyltransferase MnmD [Cyclobacteriaceae bacterium]